MYIYFTRISIFYAKSNFDTTKGITYQKLVRLKCLAETTKTDQFFQLSNYIE